MRLRSAHHITSQATPPSSPSSALSQTQGFSPLMIVTAIAMAVFGIVLGKFFL